MEEDGGNSAEAPLMRPASAEGEHGGDGMHGVQERDLTSPSRFIWALTFSAGISGLLFGYEYCRPQAETLPVSAALSRDLLF